MKRGPLVSFLISALVLPVATYAHGGPGFDGPGFGGPGFGGPHPGFYDVMPPGYKTVIAAGVTYFVLDNLWYVMHGNRYEQVSAPPSNVTVINNTVPATTTVVTTNYGMNVVDVNGIRYYMKDGRYYRRDVNGQLLEVAPPLN